MFALHCCAGAAQHDGDQAIGTWSYLAPEYKQRGRSSVRTDIYAYGLTVSTSPRA